MLIYFLNKIKLKGRVKVKFKNIEVFYELSLRATGFNLDTRTVWFFIFTYKTFSTETTCYTKKCAWFLNIWGANIFTGNRACCTTCIVLFITFETSC